MKRYITFVLVAMSLVGLVACSNDNGIAAPDGEAQVALRFESSSMTRADEVAGSDALNENLIKTIDCYFYSANADEYDDAVWYQKFTFGTDGAGINSSASVTDILMPSGEMNAIFGTGTTGKIYAIANYAGGDALPTSGADTSVANLKEMVVTTAWLDTNSKFQKQTSFVMDSEMVEITKDGNTIKRTEAVPLTRTAAKVELTITDVEEAVSSTTTSADGTPTTTWYVPAILDASNNPTGANVTMYNARTKAGVGGIAQTYSEDSSLKLENYGFSKSTVAGALYKQTNPFYTYPHTWESSEQEASLLLVVYWQATDKESKDDEVFDTVGDAIPCYYEIPIGLADNKAISRNHIYQIGINVGTLGSFVKEDPKLLEPSYMVVDWGTGNISAKIKGQRYLVVDKKKVEIFNQNVYDITFASSHPVSAVITKITKPNVSGRIEQTTTIYQNTNGATTITPSGSGNNNPFNVSVVDGKIVLSHVLNNDSNTNSFDYVPYDITVLVTNSVGMSEEITYRQYPEMYISVDLNSDYNNDNNNSNDNNNRGFAWVNNSRSTLGNLNGYSTSNSNSNPNMIIITTSALGSSSNFIIGDPRVADVNNLNYGNSWASVQDINGTTRRLSNYYPTNTSSEMRNVISPKFRIASSYGLTSAISFTNAQLRCASYQEDGYPAGRWRVPTSAELKYIVELSAKGYITKLFNDDGDYWAADGKYYTPHYNTGVVDENTAGSNKTAYVRCVYDDWYWGSEPIADKTKFTWGDMPRNN